jgi:hypothetical protein
LPCLCKVESQTRMLQSLRVCHVVESRITGPESLVRAACAGDAGPVRPCNGLTRYPHADGGTLRRRRGHGGWMVVDGDGGCLPACLPSSAARLRSHSSRTRTRTRTLPFALSARRLQCSGNNVGPRHECNRMAWDRFGAPVVIIPRHLTPSPRAACRVRSVK